MGDGKAVDLAPFCGILSIIAGGGGLAAETPIRAPAMQSVLDCRAIADAGQRLACFDKAVDAMAKAERTGDLLTIDREQRRAVRRQAFGLTLPSLAIFDRGEKAEEANRISVKLASARRTAEGRWVMKLDDGAVWRQTDDNELLHDPHDGSTALITKGVLGSFFMKVDGQSAIRVRRDS